MGFAPVPRLGDWVRLPDGSRARPIEDTYPDLRISVQDISWRVRAVEADTWPFDLILGGDWLREHDVLVHDFGTSVSLRVTRGRIVLQFMGHPATLDIVDCIPEPHVAPVAPVTPPAPAVAPPEAPEEGHAGIVPAIVDEGAECVTDED